MQTMENGKKESSGVTDVGLTEQHLRGEVRKVIYESDDASYSVLGITDPQGVEHTVVGNFAGVYEGQGVELRGVWERHKEHGRQFRANSYKFVLPSTPDGIKRYMSSGILPGIGPKFAEKIVDTFGDKTLEIMDRFSARLREVPGLGKKRIEAIRKAWADNRDRRNIYIFLQGLGISGAYCNRIYKTYGDQSADMIKENPYRLADEVKGIGFVMADRVAFALGIGKNDPKRLASGILYALNQLRLLGHVCCPEDALMRYASELLEVDAADIRKELDEVIAAKNACLELSGSERIIYEAGLYAAETELPRLLGNLINARKHSASRIMNISSPPRLVLSPEQKTAVDRVAQHPISIITGGPGVGKTTVVGEIVRRASAARLKIFLAAPTGRAAKRLGEASGKSAMTIHRMLKWEPKLGHFVYGLKHPMQCDLLIVDEVSMLDLPLAVYLFRAVKPGTTVVLVGDADQLPSVGPGKILNDLIDSGAFPVTHLSKIFRQGAGSHIVSNAHNVNSGVIPELPHAAKNELSDFYWIEEDDPEHVRDLICRMVKERIPRRFGFDPMRDIQVLTPMNRGQCGTVALNMMLQDALNSGNKPQFKLGEKIFRIGDRVMQTSNNYDKNVFNGDMGRIAQIDQHENKFTVLFEEAKVEYEFIESEQLALSYAVTVHKSQGSEFPAVVLPILTQHYMLLQRKLLYTAMTRARKLLVLIGSRKAVSMAVKNVSAEPRYSKLLDRLKQWK